MEQKPIEDLDLKGIGPSKIDGLKEKGYSTIEDLGKASKDDISDVRGLGKGSQNLHRLLTWLHKHGYRDRGKYQQEKERLQQRLREIFQLDMTEDLDFGTAKVINMHRSEIENYISYELIPTVESEVERIVEEYEPDELEEKRGTIRENIGEDVIQEDGTISPEHRGIKIVDEYIELREDVITQRDARRIMADVLGYIGDFFARYYDNGDFIYQERQRAKGSEYSIPYSGSETSFYWSTKNQYYARTSDYYEEYRFDSKKSKYKYILSYEDIDGGDSDGYIMESPSNLEVDVDEKIIEAHFERREIDDTEMEERYGQSRHTEKTASEVHAEEIVSEVERIDDEYAEDLEFVRQNIRDFITETNYDFFIHKNLQDFLLKELDSFVKEEVLEYESGNYAGTNYKEHVATVFYDVSESIIELLSRIEEYKKRAYEKTKFVKNRDEVVQVKNIPEQNYETILENEEQLIEWEESLNVEVSNLTTSKLAEHPYSQMMVDTSYFDKNIITKEEPQNKLIKSDNYQALNFLNQRYRNNIKCIYIDPPYNTGNANFAYKDNYQRSTWLSMMYNRLRLSKSMLTEDGLIFTSIDESEVHTLKYIMNSIFGEENYIAELSVITSWTGNSDRFGFTDTHEYMLCYANSLKKADIGKIPLEDSELDNWEEDSDGMYKQGHNLIATGEDAPRHKRPNLFFPIYVTDENEVHVEKPDSNNYEIVKPKRNGEDMRWTWSKKKFENNKNNTIIKRTGDDSISVYKKIRPDESGSPKKKLKTVLKDPRYYSTRGTKNIKNLFGERKYDYPKSPELIRDIVDISTEDGDIVLDFFAGSGTTAQAVHELNRERDEQVNYIMVEMLDEAFSITTERVKRTAYAGEWSDGNPQIKKNGGYAEVNFDAEMLELESYNETLETLLHNQSETKDIFDYDEQLIDYSLDFDKSLKQNLIKMDSPATSDYKIRSENGLQSIDMETTFNYLIGLREIEMDEFRIDGTEYAVYSGFNSDREKVKVVWRHGEVDHGEEKDKIEYESFDHIFVNGDSAIPNAQSISERINSILTQGDNV